MAAEWQTVTLGSVLRGGIRHGIYKPLEAFGIGTRVLKMGLQYSEDRIGPQEMSRVPLSNEEMERFRAYEGDLLFSRTSMMSDGAGKCSLVVKHSEPFVFDGNILCGTPDTSMVEPEFIYFFLKSRAGKQAISEIIAGTQARSLSGTNLAAVEILCPPLSEQRAITKILGALDDKIELNRRMNATLEAMVRALFQSWFVDFDPVRTKLDGRPPTGLDPETAALFPATFQDSPLGHIPQGWVVKPVGEVVECVGGGTPSTKEPKFWEGGIHHWTTPKDFSSLQAPILLETSRKLTDEGIAKISSGLLPAGTLLLSSRAPVGYLAIASLPVAINQGFIAMKCNENASNYFMLNWCQANMAEIEGRATGTTFAEISKRSFRPIPVVLAPNEIMSAFTERVAPLYESMAANLRQSRVLIELRDALLPKLLSGAFDLRGGFSSSGLRA